MEVYVKRGGGVLKKMDNKTLESIGRCVIHPCCLEFD